MDNQVQELAAVVSSSLLGNALVAYSSPFTVNSLGQYVYDEIAEASVKQAEAIIAQSPESEELRAAKVLMAYAEEIRNPCLRDHLDDVINKLSKEEKS